MATIMATSWRRAAVRSWLSLAIGGSILISGVVAAEPYTPADAARDAAARIEADQRAAWARQLGWNELLRERAAAPAFSPYLPPAAGYDPWWGATPSAWWYDFRLQEYRWFDRVRQPIDQEQRQTGPHRWESHPVYAEPPGASRPFFPPAGATIPPPLPTPPAAPLRGGPREF